VSATFRSSSASAVAFDHICLLSYNLAIDTSLAAAAAAASTTPHHSHAPLDEMPPRQKSALKLRLRPSGERGHFSNHWLQSAHTFSFAQYRDNQFNGWVRRSVGFLPMRTELTGCCASRQARIA